MKNIRSGKLEKRNKDRMEKENKQSKITMLHFSLKRMLKDSFQAF